jgi:hypothetical protein
LKNIALTSGQTFFFSTANQDATINQVNCTIDLANATITSAVVGVGVTVSNVALDNYGNGWYRARFTFSFAVGGSGAFLRLRQNSTVGYNTAFYVWGAQFETGSVATSYIPTTTAAITRGADLISKTGVSSLIGQTEGTIYAEVVISNTPSTFRSIFEINDGTGSGNNRIILRINTSGNFDFLVVTAGNIVCNFNTLAATAGTYKMAFAYQQNNFAAYVNGNLYGNDPSGALSSISYSAALCGHGDGNIHYFNNRIRASALYPTRLSNTDLALLTA